MTILIGTYEIVKSIINKEMETLFNGSPTAGAAFCRTNYIDYGSRVTGVTGMIQDNEGIVQIY